MPLIYQIFGAKFLFLITVSSLVATNVVDVIVYHHICLGSHVPKSCTSVFQFSVVFYGTFYGHSPSVGLLMRLLSNEKGINQEHETLPAVLITIDFWYPFLSI